MGRTRARIQTADGTDTFDLIDIGEERSAGRKMPI
jgi:hypothetical protein